MWWTFGLITAGKCPHLPIAIESIHKYGPPGLKLIVVGGAEEPKDVDLWVPFDESHKAGWLTLKKNIIVHAAEEGPICFMHDYLVLEPGWKDGVEAFGYDWITCMHRVLNQNGDRYRDWCMISNDAWMDPPIDPATPPAFPGRLLDYNNNSWGRWQYYSGAYFCAMKEAMLRVPMNNERLQCQGEDVEWSRRLYQEYGQEGFTMNTLAAARFQKHKDPVPWQRLAPL